MIYSMNLIQNVRDLLHCVKKIDYVKNMQNKRRKKRERENRRSCLSMKFIFVSLS